MSERLGKSGKGTEGELRLGGVAGCTEAELSAPALWSWGRGTP